MRYWIKDQDHTPQRYPLQRLLHRVLELAGAPPETCRISRARGYGKTIHSWGEALDAAESIDVPLKEFDDLSQGSKEWFYDLEARLPGVNVLFGLHDSTALFVEGDPDLVKRITEHFRDVQLAS